MKKFDIKPGIGVGPVNLGMNRNEVLSVMGPAEFSNEESDAFLSGFRVDYDTNNKVKFIELAESNKYEALFNGRCLHHMPADEVVEYLSTLDSYNKDDPELGHSYTFRKLNMSIWRSTVPEPDQPIEDPDGRYFEAVAIAVEGYFNDPLYG